jgi:hypothetical protein
VEEQPSFSIWNVITRAFVIVIGLVMLPVIVVLALISVTMSVFGVILAELGKLLLVPTNDMVCAIFAPHQSQLFRVSGQTEITEHKDNDGE